MTDELLDEVIGQDAKPVAAIAGLAQAAASPKRVVIDDQVRALLQVLPPGYTVHREAIDPAPHPIRKRGASVNVATVESLVEYVKSSADTPGEVTAWVHPTSGRVEVVLNDHGAKLAGWRDHRAVLQLQKTVEWNFWTYANEKMMKQEDFADHIDRGIKEIIAPAAADMLEMAQHFQATVGVEFKKGKRLASGEQQVVYVETIDARAGKSGQFEFPAEFIIRVAPFLGEDPVDIRALTRFKIDGGQLRIQYILDRPQEVIQKCVDALVGKFRAADFKRVYVGTP